MNLEDLKIYAIIIASIVLPFIFTGWLSNLVFTLTH